MIISNNQSNSLIGQWRKSQLKDAVWDGDDRLPGTRDSVAQLQCGQAPEKAREGVRNKALLPAVKILPKTHSGMCRETRIHYYAPSSYHRKPSGLSWPINSNLQLGGLWGIGQAGSEGVKWIWQVLHAGFLLNVVPPGSCFSFKIFYCETHT